MVYLRQLRDRKAQGVNLTRSNWTSSLATLKSNGHLSASGENLGQLKHVPFSPETTVKGDIDHAQRGHRAFRASLREISSTLAIVLALQCRTVAGFSDVDLAAAPDPHMQVYGTAGDQLGYAVCSVGDVNNDGYTDILVTAAAADGTSRVDAGAAYLFFGSAGESASTIDSASLTTAAGIKVLGPAANTLLGISASSAGDLNKDGYDDILIGAITYAPFSRSAAGGALVIFGKATGSWADIDSSSDLAGAGDGYWIYGAAGNYAGWSVSAAGDVNNDGNPDLVVGAIGVSHNSAGNAGCGYVIFGQGTATTANDIDLATFTSSSTNGFRVFGSSANQNCGTGVGGAGDVNDDSYDDVLVGCQGATYSGRTEAGSVFVLFGHSSATPYIDLDLASMTSAYGFIINGPAASAFLGWAVGKAGDVNSDGIDDFVVGAFQATYSGRTECGAAYVIFGRTSGFSDIDTASFTSGSEGFLVIGAAASDGLGRSVAGGGDVDGDGIDDVVVGAPGGSPSSRTSAGVSYVILGHPSSYTFTDVDTASLTSAQGSTISGAVAGDSSGFSVGLVTGFNGDGGTDVLVGANFADPSSRSNAGTAYLLYGASSPTAAPSPATTAHCDAGTYISAQTDSSTTCTPCPVDTYTDQQDASACQSCSYPYGTVGSGSSQCDTVHVGLPALGTAPLFGLLGIFVLCFLATQTASLTAAVVAVVLVSSLDLLTDLVYILSAKFVTGAVFGLCVAFFLLRAAPFLYRLYEMGHWYPCFRASFYTIPEWVAAGEGSPVTAALVLVMVLLYPLYLACHLVFAAVWLVVGCFLHQTGVMALRRVKDFWVQVWRGEVTAAFTAPTAAIVITPEAPWVHRDLVVVGVIIVLPEIILQLYNQEKVRYTAIGIISVIASGLMILFSLAAAVVAVNVGWGTAGKGLGPGGQYSPAPSVVGDQQQQHAEPSAETELAPAPSADSAIAAV